MAADELEAYPKTILVVDDDESVLGVVKCMLECGDYNVLTANSAGAAARIAQQAEISIDVLLTDVVMPEMNGPELSRLVLSVRPGIRVLFMSGFTDSEVVRIRVVDAGLNYLPKPFTSTGLLESVKRLLSEPPECAMTVRLDEALHTV